MKRHLPRRDKLDGIPLDIKGEMALKEAVADAIAEHKLRGHPIVIWREGKVVTIPPEEIAVPVAAPKRESMDGRKSKGRRRESLRRTG
jgi:hypothetical protein